MLTPSQLENTRNFIGGTKAAAILGLSEYKTPLDVYYEIVHQIRDESIDEKENVKFGKLLEDVIAKESAERLGCDIIEPHETYTHKHYPWLIAHPDRLIVGKKEGLEIKNRSFFMSKNYGEEFTDEALPSEIIQCQHYMNVLGYDRFYLCVLLGGQKLKIMTIERNDNLISQMQQQLNDFWHKNILDRVPPPPKDLKEVNSLFKESNAQTIECGIDIAALCDVLINIKNEINYLENKKENLEKEIKIFMKENEVLEFENKKIASWKTHGRERFDKASFEKDYPDLYKMYSSKTNMRVFRLAKEA